MAYTPAGNYIGIENILDFKAFIAYCDAEGIKVTLSNAWAQDPAAGIKIASARSMADLFHPTVEESSCRIGITARQRGGRLLVAINAGRNGLGTPSWVRGCAHLDRDDVISSWVLRVPRITK
jgi:hypothetical protein